MTAANILEKPGRTQGCHPTAEMWEHAGSHKSYHGQGHDANQVLLADEDLRHSDVCGSLTWVFNLPGDGLSP